MYIEMNTQIGESLPSETEFPLSYNGDLRIKVQPDLVPMISDEALDARAQVNQDWDIYSQFQYGEDPANYTLQTKYDRFAQVYEGERVDLPVAFTEALLDSERQIPTLHEYAKSLEGKGWLRPEEADAAKEVTRLDSMDIVKRAKTEDLMDEDSRWLYDTTKYKLEYFINLEPGALAEHENPKRLAEKYAEHSLTVVSEVSKRLDMNGAGRTKHQPEDEARALKHKWSLLLQARGLSSAEIKAGTNKYRELGVDAELATHILDHPQGSMFRPVQSVDHNLLEALSGRRGLTTELAVRKFFGIRNMYDLLTYQADLDRSQHGRNGSSQVATAMISLSQENGFRILQPSGNGETTVVQPSEEQLQLLNIVAAREPALRSQLGYIGRNMALEYYVDKIRAQVPELPEAWIF
jgi:hypothetical protein